MKPLFKSIHKYYKQYKLNKGALEIPDPIEFVKPELIQVIEENAPPIPQQHENAKKAKWTLLALIFIIPLLFSDVSGRVLDSVMRFSNLNIGVSSVLGKPPYNKTFSEKYKDVHPVYAEEGFIAFKDIDVKLSGIGQKNYYSIYACRRNKAPNLTNPK